MKCPICEEEIFNAYSCELCENDTEAVGDENVINTSEIVPSTGRDDEEGRQTKPQGGRLVDFQ